jgi:hypothetical protein
MAISIRSAMQRLTVLPGRLVSVAAANPGLLALVFTILIAGVLAFYLVILPPSTAVYP